MTRKSSQPDFDRVARIYRWAEYLALGPILQRTRTHFLPAISEHRSALVLGDGDGRFLAALLASNSEIEALAVDTSECMLNLLHKRCAFAGERLRTEQASAFEIKPFESTDLIVSHFFLDCLHQHEVDTLVRSMAAHCKPGVVWLISDFQLPARGWRRAAAAVYIRLLYFAFRVLTGLRVQRLPDTRAALLASGFRRTQYKEKLGGLIHTELWQLSQRPLE